MSITDYRHPSHVRNAPLWTKVRDCCAGEDAIKGRGESYLPDPSGGAEKDPLARAARYQSYLQRAVYLNATGRTLQALVGIAFANWPRVALHPWTKYLADDVDGSGVGIINQSQRVLSEVLQTGRCGLLSDATSMDEGERARRLSVGEAEKRGHRAMIVAYTAEQILTWEYAGRQLSRLVLLEQHVDYTGGEVNEVQQLRELVMRDGRCVVNLWRQLEGKTYHLVSTKETSFGRIPFQFVGATNNDATPDLPPLLDLANLNLAHYRNSADFEESAFLLGQPQMVLTGVNEEWIEKVGAIHIGARAALPLPQGADAKLLQVQPNTLAQVAMKDKEAMMAAVGARLLESRPTLTATQSASETKSGYSQLSLACDNVSEAYRRALQEIAKWYGNPTTGIDFAIDTRFNDLTLDANAIRETVAAWQAGMIPASDAWTVLRRLGVVDQGKSDEQLRSELDAAGPGLDLDAAA